MKTLKIIIIFLLNFLLLLAHNTPIKTAPPKTTKASEIVWARIINDQTPFFSDMACSLVKFILPKSYFVKVLQLGDDSTRVIYMDNDLSIPAREGYIKTCDLKIFEGAVYNPYPNFAVKITADEILFADSNKKYPKTVLSYGDSALLYGTLTIEGENFCYVYANGYIGYVRRSAFAPFEVPMHEIPITPPVTSEESVIGSLDEQPDLNTNSTVDSTMKIVVIIALSITCLSVVYLLFKPKYDHSIKLAVSQDNDDDF